MKTATNGDGDSNPPNDISEAFECVVDAANAAAAARMGERGDGGSILVIDGIKGGGRREGRLADPVTGAVDGLRGKKMRGEEVAVHNNNSAAGASVDALDLEPDKVQVVTLWDKEARKNDIYKVAYSIFPAGGLTPLCWLSCGIGLRFLWQNCRRNSS